MAQMERKERQFYKKYKNLSSYERAILAYTLKHKQNQYFLLSVKNEKKNISQSSDNQASLGQE